MTTPNEKAAIKSYLASAREALNKIETIIDSSIPTPPPVTTKKFAVTDDKSVVKQIGYVNKSGYPVMEIYPNGDNTDTNDRVVYRKGKTLDVYPTSIKADSNGEFYEISQVFDKAKRLFVDAKTGKLT